jgi:hypothetical protein
MDVTFGDEALVYGSAAQVVDSVRQKVLAEKEAELESVRAEVHEAELNRDAPARRAGRVLSRIATGLTVLLLFVVTGTASFIPVPLVPQAARFVALLAATAVAVYAIANSEFGFRLTALSRGLELTIATRLNRWLRRIAGYR